MTVTGAPALFCTVCGDRMWSVGAHIERCYGRPRTAAPGARATPTLSGASGEGNDPDTGAAEQPVREVAHAIASGEAFCDVDARRVADAYLNVLVAGPYMGNRE